MTIFLDDETLYKVKESFFTLGYAHIKDVLSPDLILYLKKLSHLIDYHNILVTEKSSSEIKTISEGSEGYNGLILTDALLLFFQDFYSNIAERPLDPTYSFFRKYKKGNSLTKHVDREACQFSLTMCVNESEDNEWDFFIKDFNGKIKNIKSKIGDVIIYQGENVLHWREPLTIEESYHIFLHWVDATDPVYKEWKFDKRKYLGYSSNPYTDSRFSSNI